MSGSNNPATASGGPTSGSFGELLGYAGPGPLGGGIAPAIGALARLVPTLVGATVRH